MHSGSCSRLNIGDYGINFTKEWNVISYRRICNDLNGMLSSNTAINQLALAACTSGRNIVFCLFIECKITDMTQ